MNNNNTPEDKVEYPLIYIQDDCLYVKMPKDILIEVIEGRNDENYKVLQPEQLLERFAFYLANYAESNAVETGLNELQVLFDKVTDELVESGEDIIDLKNDDDGI